jgi:hypothetical protein
MQKIKIIKNYLNFNINKLKILFDIFRRKFINIFIKKNKTKMNYDKKLNFSSF